MMIQQILDTVTSFDRVLVLAPDASSGAPEIAWGDYFFYYAPDGRVPANVQPYGTIVTKNYPGDTESDLEAEDRWRVNIHVGRTALERLTGQGVTDPAEPDVVLPHPVYGRQGWIAVVNPGERTSAQVLDLLRDAHERAKDRVVRKLG
ncbi:DUF6194 family protein [Prauserella sp. PE36]|uniref:DUF6194 family protein n=1 Tax=Prauserella sp. PE36 TaxID=1504709 RepID=UPI0018F35327|nr:DUF6194 family protein [Prauserella sp. PE36]